MATAPATKGFSSPISVQGSSTGKIADYDTYAQFKPKEVVKSASPGPTTFKFPLDDVSAGNFWTRLIVNSWVPTRPTSELVDKQGHKLSRYLIANIWLPMPLQLSTAYNQNFSETDNMMMNRGSGISDMSTLKGFGETFWNQGKAAGAGMMNEGAEFVASIVNVNNSGKMNLGSIMNQQMGLVYDGAALRSHSLSWKMTPKSKEEQAAISKVVFALKKYSAPIIMGPLGGEVNHGTSVEALEVATERVMESGMDFLNAVRHGAAHLNADARADADNEYLLNPQPKVKENPADDLDSMRNIGRLGIPATINAEFWFGDAVNPNLFQIKDSFITSVEVNYTPSGTWNAYKDGAPIETQLSITLKENAVISQQDIHKSGGY